MSKKRYEYSHVEAQQPEELAAEMEKSGRSGWELVNVIRNTDSKRYVAFLEKKIRLGKSHDSDE